MLSVSISRNCFAERNVDRTQFLPDSAFTILKSYGANAGNSVNLKNTSENEHYNIGTHKTSEEVENLLNRNSSSIVKRIRPKALDSSYPDNAIVSQSLD